MAERDIKGEYRGWRYQDDIPLITKDKQWADYFDAKFAGIDIDVDIDTDEIKEVIEDTINENFEGKFDGIYERIDHAENHLCCDICCAKNKIIKHIDDKIDPINFEEKFSNLNEQVEEILQKLNS